MEFIIALASFATRRARNASGETAEMVARACGNTDLIAAFRSEGDDGDAYGLRARGMARDLEDIAQSALGGRAARLSRQRHTSRSRDRREDKRAGFARSDSNDEEGDDDVDDDDDDDDDMASYLLALELSRGTASAARGAPPTGSWSRHILLFSWHNVCVLRVVGVTICLDNALHSC